MSIRRATPQEISQWDDLIAANPDGGTLYQSATFAEIKSAGGWQPVHLVIELDSLSVTALFLQRRIPFLGLLWYSPTGPGFTSAEQLAAIIQELRTFARRNGVFLVKLESELPGTAESRAVLQRAGLVKADDVQPISSTVILDLTPPTDEILAKMPQKGRYAIRKAARDGVTVADVDLTDDVIDRMYGLLKNTGDASGFAVRPQPYYDRFWRLFDERGQGRMFFAYVDGEVVAGAYSAWLGAKAWYKDGASIRERKAYGASHALQWHIIEWHKQRGTATSYDMMGAPPSDRVKDETHPLHGIGVFKTSFSETITDRTGTWDLVVNARAARLWNRIGYRVAGKVNRTRRGEVFF